MEERIHQGALADARVEALNGSRLEAMLEASVARAMAFGIHEDDGERLLAGEGGGPTNPESSGGR